jgi:hypothetical protein
VDEDGRLQTKSARQEIADFTIRLPHHPHARRITIRKIGDVPPGIQRLTDATDVIGVFEIDLDGEDGP